MKFIKKNYGWMIVVILAILPMFLLIDMINFDFSNGVTLIEGAGGEGKSTLEMLYHITGEFAVDG